MNIKNKLKQCLINPCKKCLVNACCISQCEKLQIFEKFQNDLLIILGLIIAAILLIICGYIIFIFTSGPIYVFCGLVWLITGTWIYTWHLSTNEKWFMSIFIIILPYLLMGLLIGTLLTGYKKNLRR